MPAAFDQQAAQAFEQGLVRFAKAGQAEQPGQWLAEVTQRLLRGDEGEPRAAYRTLAVQPPEPFAQRQRLDLLQHAGKAVFHALGTAQQARAAPDQFVEVVSGNAQFDHLRIQRQFLGRTLQQVQQGFGAVGPAQGLDQIVFTECTGQQLQQAQVLVRARGDGNGQVDDLAVAPIHAVGKLHQAHTGAEHQFAGFRGAVGNGDTLTKKRRALRLASLQAGQITLGDQAVTNQVRGQQLQGGGLVRRVLAHGYLRRGELEHDPLLCDAASASRYCCKGTSIGPAII